jgi:hypothetical protein
MPTLLTLCDIPIPASVEGLDYSAYMKGGPNPNPDNAALISCIAPFAEWNRLVGGKEFRGLRTARHTYVRDLKGPWLLYDNDKDPYQQRNLVGVAEFHGLQTQLDTLLNARLKAAGDEFRPADYYLAKWAYEDRVNDRGALPASP